MHLTSVVCRDTINHVARRIDDAVATGATSSAGGAPDGGMIMPARVVSDVTSDIQICKVEPLGPVTTLIRPQGEDDAVATANDGEYLLPAAVQTRDVMRQLEIAKWLETGIANFNGPTVGDEAQTHFGVVKAPGDGRFGGTAGIAEFTEPCWTTVEGPK